MLEPVTKTGFLHRGPHHLYRLFPLFRVLGYGTIPPLLANPSATDSDKNKPVHARGYDHAVGLNLLQGALGAVAQESCRISGLMMIERTFALFSCVRCDSVRFPWPCCPDNASVLCFCSTRALEQAWPCLVSLGSLFRTSLDCIVVSVPVFATAVVSMVHVSSC